jgi:undecaprenyl-diphosphatase
MSVGAAARRAAVVRTGRDAVLLICGAAVLVLAAMPVEATRVSPAGTAVFGAVNGVDVAPFILGWPVMQRGNLLVVPATALPDVFGGVGLGLAVAGAVRLVVGRPR